MILRYKIVIILIIMMMVPITTAYALTPFDSATIIKQMVQGFCNFNVVGYPLLKCTAVNDTLNITHGSGITLISFQANKTLWFNGTGSAGPQGPIGPPGDPASDTNTAQIKNAQSSGTGLFGTRNNATENTIKVLWAGVGISFSNNSTAVTITNTIVDTDTNTAQGMNLGTNGVGVYASNFNATQLQFLKLLCIDANCSLSSNSTNVILTVAGFTDTNTAQISDAQSSGNGLVGSKLNATANTIKVVFAGTGISISSNSTAITISSTITDTNTAQMKNAGNGTGLFGTRNNATENTIKSLRCSSGVSCTSNSTDVAITNTGVTSVIGTSGNITASSSTGDVTLNLGNLVVMINGAAQTISKIITYTADIVMSSANINLGSNFLTNLGHQIGLPANSGTICLANQTGTCGADQYTGNVTKLDDLSDVVISGATSGQFLYTNGGGTVFKNKSFKDNTQTCAGGTASTAFNNSTGLRTCTAFGNVTKLDDLSDVKITSLAKGHILYSTASTLFRNTAFKANTKTCSAGQFISTFSNSSDSSCSTPSATSREYLVANWEADQPLTNIGTSFVNVYSVSGNNGDAIRIDTNGMATVTLQIIWSKIGTGTQSCEIRDNASPNSVLVRINSLSTGINTNATQTIPSSWTNTILSGQPLCKSTTSLDDPVWYHGVVLLKP